MKISYDLTLDDWLAFNKHYISHSKTNKKTKALMTLVFILIWFVLFIVVEYNPILFVSFTIIWLAIMSLFYDRITLSQSKKMIKEGDNSNVLGRHEIEFLGDQFIIKCPNIENKTQWTAVKKFEENEKYIFLYISAMAAYIIPKFKLGHDEKKFVETLKDKIKENK